MPLVMRGILNNLVSFLKTRGLEPVSSLDEMPDMYSNQLYLSYLYSLIKASIDFLFNFFNLNSSIKASFLVSNDFE